MNLTGLFIGHTVVVVSYVIRSALTSLSLLDPSIPRAAAILDARPMLVFWYAVMPTLRPGLVAGSLFAFLSSFNNVVISVFLSTPGNSPLPVVIFNRMDNLAEPTSAAAASVTIVLTAVVIAGLEKRFGLFRTILGASRP